MADDPEDVIALRYRHISSPGCSMLTLTSIIRSHHSIGTHYGTPAKCAGKRWQPCDTLSLSEQQPFHKANSINHDGTAQATEAADRRSHAFVKPRETGRREAQRDCDHQRKQCHADDGARAKRPTRDCFNQEIS